MQSERIDRKKRYYQKHRSKILKSLKNKRKPDKCAPFALNLSEIFPRIMSHLNQNAEKLLLAALVLACTAFLVIESARTLAAIEGAGALWKAALCELVLVGTSMLTASTRRMQVLRVAVLMGIGLLSLLNTIGGPLTHFAEANQNARLKADEVLIMSRNIADKQTLLSRYLDTDRISGARRIESEIAALSDRLTQTKEDLTSQKSEFILALGFGITVLFRLVIMAANVIFSNRLSQLIRELPVATCPKNVATSRKLFLVGTPSVLTF